jgi:hypothetical protein
VFDHTVIDTERSQSDRVRDRNARARAVRDDDETAEPEEVSAAVGFGIETISDPPGSRPDEEPTEPPS